MTLQFEEVLSDRFRMVFSIRMAQDLWGFMGISWIYPQMNGWCSSWRDWGLLNFDTNPSSLFRKPWVFFNGGSTRSLIDFWLDCSTSIDSMGYSYIYTVYIFIGSVCWWRLVAFFVYIQGGAIPWDIHWISVLVAMLGPHRIFAGGISEQFPISSLTIPVGSSKWSIFSAGWLCRVYRCLSVYPSLSRPFLKKKSSFSRDVHSFSHSFP